MKRLLIGALMLCVSLQFTGAQLPWSQRMANSVMLSNPTTYGSSLGWNYVNGVVMSGFQALYKKTNNVTYLNYIQATVKAQMSGFSTYTKTLDNVKEGTAVLFMYQNTTSSTDKTSYQTKAASIRTLLGTTSAGISRTSEGGFWHKDPSYPWQMWGDGLYMAEPFYAQYSVLFNSSATADFDDIANQFILFETHTRDAKTGLLYHGWSEQPLNSLSTAWADPVTGHSKSFWGRAMGWYIMGLVDVLDYMPANHPKRPALIAILQRLVPALIAVQDPTSGCWYDVVDQGTRCSSITPANCNYLESSASCMITYSILKAVRLGYVNSSYLAAGKKAYEGLINTFVTTNGDAVTINNNCQVGGLGGSANRDGSFDYYMSEPIVSSDVDGKPIGPFILASLEYEALPVVTAIKENENNNFQVSCLTNKNIEVSFSIQVPQKVSISILDIKGRTVRQLLLEKMMGGTYKELFSLEDLRSGIYIVQYSSENEELSKKISLH